MHFISTSFKAIRKLIRISTSWVYSPLGKLNFILNGVQYKKGISIRGIIKVFVTRRGRVEVGKNFRINSGFNHNVIGRQQKTIFWVEGNLTIKDNVGISATAIICKHNIIIGNNVIIGGNTVIYDTNFHSLNASDRNTPELDRSNTLSSPVIIEDNVFIGAHVTILKGVTIGANSVIGACSLISKNIPKNEVWAGNPAKFIKSL